MNKKADITIIILVLGIVAVCFFAIITFVNSNTSTQNSFKTLRIIWDMNQRIESGTLTAESRTNCLRLLHKKDCYEYYLEEEKHFIFPISRLPKILFRIRYYPPLGS